MSTKMGVQELAKHVKAKLDEGTTPSYLVTHLESFGLSRQVAEYVVRQVSRGRPVLPYALVDEDSVAPEHVVQQIMRGGGASPRAVAPRGEDSVALDGVTEVILGVVMLVVALGVTGITYALASVGWLGGVYIVTVGLGLWGVFMIVGGLVKTVAAIVKSKL